MEVVMNKIFAELYTRFDDDFADDLRDELVKMTKEELIEKHIDLAKRFYDSDYFRDILFTVAAPECYYWNPYWDGSEVSDEKIKNVIERWCKEI
jgi:hypothetical protein